MSEPRAADGSVGQAYVAAARRRLTDCHEKLTHCVSQLEDRQVWWRPREDMNSVANILLHLCGNIRQWIVAGVVGAPDVRDRPAEFAERAAIPRDELLRRLAAVVAEADTVLAGADAVLLERRTIQSFDMTVLSAVFDCLAHLNGHTQEVTYICRLQLGDAYRFAWVPTPEQGGAAAEETVAVRDAAFADLRVHPLAAPKPEPGVKASPPDGAAGKTSTGGVGTAPPVESLKDYVRDLGQEFQEEQDEGKVP